MLSDSPNVGQQAASDGSSSKSSTNSGLVAGVVVSVAALLLLVIALLVVRRRKKNSRVATDAALPPDNNTISIHTNPLYRSPADTQQPQRVGGQLGARPARAGVHSGQAPHNTPAAVVMPDTGPSAGNYDMGATPPLLPSRRSRARITSSAGGQPIKAWQNPSLASTLHSFRAEPPPESVLEVLHHGDNISGVEGEQHHGFQIGGFGIEDDDLDDNDITA